MANLVIYDGVEENMATNVSREEFERAVLNVTTCRQVKIDKVANGFIVEIGCKKFVGENWEVLAKQLGEYWKDPVAAEKKYAK